MQVKVQRQVYKNIKNTREINIELIKQAASKYDYALVYEMSQVYWQSPVDIDAVCWEEIIEARFFDTAGQLHVYMENMELCAVEIVETDGLQAVKVGAEDRKDAESDCLGNVESTENVENTGIVECILEYQDISLILDKYCTQNEVFKEKVKEKIRIRKYLDYDEDGQIYIKTTRLCV